MDKEGKVDAKSGKVLSVSLIGIKSNKDALIETEQGHIQYKCGELSKDRRFTCHD